MSRPIIEIEGFPELMAKIKMLSDPKDKKREVLIILRQVASVTLKTAQSLVPVSRKQHKARGKLIQPGNLRKSLGNITGKSENPTVYIGPRAKGSNDGWYGHFVHDGHNIYAKGYRRKRIRGANMRAALKRTAGNPYMAKAYEATNGQVTADAEKKITAFIQRRIDKLS
ncbi:hypothetical protein [uncultured Flavobacterium sp.]|uniref:hypothetical protein n=1 Tax=uncultured Flavobacterium sp. TaxID=165435 RepID=UPI0025D350A8|nr:hypothetical protein [uncultured Flavobacterium sp.]